MFEMRWLWHDMKNGAPPTGCICIDIDSRLYQKLQYRYRNPVEGTLLNAMPEKSWAWTDWIDVPHGGLFE